MKEKARWSLSLFSNKAGVRRNYCKALAKETIPTTNTWCNFRPQRCYLMSSTRDMACNIIFFLKEYSNQIPLYSVALLRFSFNQSTVCYVCFWQCWSRYHIKLADTQAFCGTPGYRDINDKEQYDNDNVPDMIKRMKNNFWECNRVQHDTSWKDPLNFHVIFLSFLQKCILPWNN